MEDLEASLRSKGSLIELPAETKERLQSDAHIGVVQSIGSSAFKGSKNLPEDYEPEVKVGDRIAIRRYGGYGITLNGEKFRVIRDDCILGVLDKEDTIGEL